MTTPTPATGLAARSEVDVYDAAPCAFPRVGEVDLPRLTDEEGEG